ncbi:cwf18 pre-mRNA splicing factor-domain-containing protein [Phascolomyces articulosus]|uniref:Cwf18 pre-mRNA splicing factor-domain-containing protein n=1 Tax=Phascolomyces articulosus TaxID=60185 RepID=A0AAD5KBQ9_9FUNG|nr:cwf18 pre-mRNA splicing factor-domain-containing protein [Phascolomyces articulosus]
MEKEAQNRKERLAALRKRKTESVSESLQFRSYTPTDENLKQHTQIATPSDIGETVESETKDYTKKALAAAAEQEKEEVDLFNLQPKKPNWDLKRDVEKKLEKLDRRTQRAILEIIRDRLSNEEDGDKTANLADAVANAEKQQKLDAEED